MPEVSVLIPVYNCESFLNEAIDSIREQSLYDFELVIVNDGSTDDSRDIIQQHALDDNRIVVVNQSNGGIVSALNAGLARCRGDYVARMDGDDIAMPSRLQCQSKFLTRNPDVVAVGSSAEVIDEDNIVFDRVLNPENDHEIRECVFKGGYALLHPTMMIRRNSLIQCGGYDQRFHYAEDLDLLLRLAGVGKLANVSASLLRYRKRRESMSTSRLGVYAQWDLKALQLARRRGQPITRSTIATAYDRISWSNLATGQLRRAIHAAILALGSSPLNLAGYKSLARLASSRGRKLSE